MIKIIYNTMFLVLLTSNLNAQKGSKVVRLFKTSAEFRDGKPSLAFECNSKNKILLNGFFNKRYITVKQGDSSYNILKKSLYGYQTCNKNVFRFLDKKELLLLNDTEQILIYKHLVSKPPTGRTNVTNYYFSIGKEGEIQELTIKKLKNAFIVNKNFLSLVDKNFKYNMDLAAFDENNKMYKINWLLKNSRN